MFVYPKQLQNALWLSLSRHCEPEGRSNPEIGRLAVGAVLCDCPKRYSWIASPFRLAMTGENEHIF
jgi:hypothetical protein